MIKTLLCICCIAVTPFSSFAEDTCHSPAPRHTCIKPVHPRASQLSEPSDVKPTQPQDYDFRMQVDQYKDCILVFAAGQRQAIKIHTTAAEDAANEWYAFVKESIASGALQER